MKAAKERKMDRKAKHKALAVAKTVKSRQRRLDNKAKRDEIHAINPDIKVVIKDQVTYDEDGNTITVYNNALSITSSTSSPCLASIALLKTSEDFDQKLQDKIKEIETVEVFNAEIEEVEAVEVDDISKFQELVNKWRL